MRKRKPPQPKTRQRVSRPSDLDEDDDLSAVDESVSKKSPGDVAHITTSKQLRSVKSRRGKQPGEPVNPGVDSEGSGVTCSHVSQNFSRDENSSNNSIAQSREHQAPQRRSRDRVAKFNSPKDLESSAVIEQITSNKSTLVENGSSQDSVLNSPFEEEVVASRGVKRRVPRTPKPSVDNNEKLSETDKPPGSENTPLNSPFEHDTPASRRSSRRASNRKSRTPEPSILKDPDLSAVEERMASGELVTSPGQSVDNTDIVLNSPFEQDIHDSTCEEEQTSKTKSRDNSAAQSDLKEQRKTKRNKQVALTDLSQAARKRTTSKSKSAPKEVDTPKRELRSSLSKTPTSESQKNSKTKKLQTSQTAKTIIEESEEYQDVSLHSPSRTNRTKSKLTSKTAKTIIDESEKNQDVSPHSPSKTNQTKSKLTSKTAKTITNESEENQDESLHSPSKTNQTKSRLGKRRAPKRKSRGSLTELNDAEDANLETVGVTPEDPGRGSNEQVTSGGDTGNVAKSVSHQDADNIAEAQPGQSDATEHSSDVPTKKAKTVKRKPNSRKSPNPKPKKKLKRPKNYDFLSELLEYEDIPLSVKAILQKEDALEDLSGAEIGTLFEDLADTVKAAAELIFGDVNNAVALKWLKSVSLLTICIIETLPPDEPIMESLSHVASLLGLLQKLNLASDLKESISEVCSLLLAKNCEFSDQIFFLTMNSLIDCILKSPAKSQRCKKSLKLLHSLERVIARLQISSKACEPLVAKFVQIAQCKDIMTVKEGKFFMSFLLTLDLSLMQRFHQAVKDTLALPQTKKSHSNGYGEAYYLAWLHSAENKEMRKAVENKCLQNYMMAIFTIQRTGLEMSSLGHNVFTILSFLHSKREHLRLSKTITTLYTPLLWRYLHFENNLIRCNAAEVFFDVYPLEYHGEAKPDRIMHLDRQHQEMAELLVDDCHLVRIIALRGLFPCMKSNWATFPPESLQMLFKIITNDCINDASSSDVRCAVYRGFTSLLDNEQCHEYLAMILPNLGNYLNDECDKVRVAFIRMLQKVKDVDIEDFKYWHVSDIKLLTLRLAKEKNESVAKALTELIFNNIFSVNHDEAVTLKRLVRLIQMNPTAARKLIQYSAKLLSYEDAFRLMTVVLATLRSHIVEKLKKIQALEAREDAAEEDDIPDDVRPKFKKRRNHNGPLSERTNNTDDNSCTDTSKSSSGDSSDSNTSKTNDSISTNKADERTRSIDKASPFDELPVSHGLFDIVSLLWIIHAGTLNSESKKEDLGNLYELATSMISIMLKYYKGTETFFGVLQLASMIPLSKLIPVCHISSACVSQLRNFGHTMPYEECRCIVNTLCAWNRGIDIIELVYDWLNEAFKVENLNFSAMPTNKERAARKKKIRFEATGVKPMCGLNLIDMVFSNPIDKQRVLTKHYDQLMELFNYLERIKFLIEKRIQNEEQFGSELLSDEFLAKCLLTYLKLAIMLHKEPEGDISVTAAAELFNANNFYLKLLQWCERTLIYNLEVEPEPVICSFINVIVQAGSTMMAVNIADKHVNAEILKVLSRCLDCGKNGLLVLESGVKFLSLTMNVSLNRYSAKSLRHVYVATIPHFLECILSAATFRNYSQETILDCVNDFVGMKKTLRELMLNYVGVHAKDKTNSILPRIVNILAKAVIQSYTHEVLKHNVAVQFVKLNNLPFFANFILTLINSRPIFCSIFLTCLNRNVAELYLNNGAQLLGTVSLLYTLAMNKFKFKPAEFNASVKLVNDILMKYRASPNDSRLDDSAGLIDSEHNLDEQDVQSQGAKLIQEISQKIELFT